MPQGRFNEYSPQEQMAMAREYLAERGLPMNTRNLNDAMYALMRGDDAPASNATQDAVTRSMQPAPQVARARPAPRPAPQPQMAELPQPMRDVRMVTQDVDAEDAMNEGDPNEDGNRSVRDMRQAGKDEEQPAREQQSTREEQPRREEQSAPRKRLPYGLRESLSARMRNERRAG
jgi:hypothetical protein